MSGVKSIQKVVVNIEKVVVDGFKTFCIYSAFNGFRRLNFALISINKLCFINTSRDFKRRELIINDFQFSQKMTKAKQKQNKKENGKRKMEKAPAPDGAGGVLYVAVWMGVVILVYGGKNSFLRFG